MVKKTCRNRLTALRRTASRNNLYIQISDQPYVLLVYCILYAVCCLRCVCSRFWSSDIPRLARHIGCLVHSSGVLSLVQMDWKLECITVGLFASLRCRVSKLKFRGAVTELSRSLDVVEALEAIVSRQEPVISVSEPTNFRHLAQGRRGRREGRERFWLPENAVYVGVNEAGRPAAGSCKPARLHLF